MKLGIFDSGIGGDAVATALSTSFPDAIIDTVNDHEHVPYGDKSPEEIIRLTDTAIQPFLDNSYDIVILACNTATAIAIETLRSRYPTQKFIGIEPMIKSAAVQTESRIIAVLATPATLASKRYNYLVQAYGSHLEILEPDCSDWAYLIENNQINRSHVESTIDNVCKRGADVIILGCTHYHWIKELITEIVAERASILEPSDAIGRRVRQIMNLH